MERLHLDRTRPRIPVVCNPLSPLHEDNGRGMLSHLKTIHLVHHAIVYITNSSPYVAEDGVINSRVENHFHHGLYSRASGLDVVGILVQPMVAEMISPG
jgi:hypothetical protein